MSERAVPGAALVAAVVLLGTIAGGLVAVGLRDDEASRPPDGEVLAALVARGFDIDEARCVLAIVADDDPLDGPAPIECRDGATTTTATTATTASTASTATATEGPLPDCTGVDGADPAAVEVCAVDALIGLLRSGTDLDEVTASCAAEAVVDELGVAAVVTALETGVVPEGLRQRLQEAFAACQ